MLPNTFTGVISAASHILWQNFLDIQDGAFYTSPHKKEVLINPNQLIIKGRTFSDPAFNLCTALSD